MPVEPLMTPSLLAPNTSHEDAIRVHEARRTHSFELLSSCRKCGSPVYARKAPSDWELEHPATAVRRTCGCRNEPVSPPSVNVTADTSALASVLWCAILVFGALAYYALTILERVVGR